jgi:hypothetical protein
MIICPEPGCGGHGRKNGCTDAGTQRYRCANGHSWVLDPRPTGRPCVGETAQTSTQRSQNRRAKKKLEGTP